MVACQAAGAHWLKQVVAKVLYGWSGLEGAILGVSRGRRPVGDRVRSPNFKLANGHHFCSLLMITMVISKMAKNANSGDFGQKHAHSLLTSAS